MRSIGAEHLAYTLGASIVDNYFIIVERSGERIESLEESLVSRPTPETLKVIHHLKGEMLFLRSAVWPIREVISGLERSDSFLIDKGTVPYLRDVYDHAIQVIDTIETHREMLSEMIGIYLSSVSFRLNEIMKMLTIIATIFMPLTFLAGVYGMNFRHMPELEWRWGYPAIWLVMIGAGVSMLLYFRKKNWL